MRNSSWISFNSIMQIRSSFPYGFCSESKVLLDCLEQHVHLYSTDDKHAKITLVIGNFHHEREICHRAQCQINCLRKCVPMAIEGRRRRNEEKPTRIRSKLSHYIKSCVRKKRLNISANRHWRRTRREREIVDWISIECIKRARDTHAHTRKFQIDNDICI